jgi:phage gp46-like protein
MKRCVSCGDEKPYGEFYARADSPDGYRNDCKVCRKSASRRVYHSDVENKKAERRAYYRKRMEADPEFHHRKYWADVERNRQICRDYYKQNREKLIAKVSEYARKNPGKANATKKKYKLAKRNACPPWVYSSRELCEKIEYYYNEAKRLGSVTGEVYHVDHIVPLQGESVCGLHVPWNLQVLTASENCSKQNRLVEEMT